MFDVQKPADLCVLACWTSSKCFRSVSSDQDACQGSVCHLKAVTKRPADAPVASAQIRCGGGAPLWAFRSSSSTQGSQHVCCLQPSSARQSADVRRRPVCARRPVKHGTPHASYRSIFNNGTLCIASLRGSRWERAPLMACQRPRAGDKDLNTIGQTKDVAVRLRLLRNVAVLLTVLRSILRRCSDYGLLYHLLGVSS